MPLIAMYILVLNEHTKYMMESINLIVNDVQTKVISYLYEYFSPPSQHIMQNVLENKIDNLPPTVEHNVRIIVTPQK